MTSIDRMEAPEREAGRALDAEVAEAFGATGRMTVYAWDDRKAHARPIVAFARDYKNPLLQDRFESYVTESGEKLRRGIAVSRPVSTLIADAWLVVAEMQSRGFHAVVKTPFTPANKYVAGFTPHGMTGWNGRPDFCAVESTAPLAICLATLKALENTHSDTPPTEGQPT